MKLGNYIHELLKENETVIIPGFGAFLSSYKPAALDEKEVRPPSREISFTQQIRNNDGLLVGYIAGQEKISHFDALKVIEKERENMIYLLDKGKEVELKETGTLFINEKNEVQLKPFYDDDLLLDSFGLEPVSLMEEAVEGPKPEEIVSSEEIQEPATQDEMIMEKPEEITGEEDTPEKTSVEEEKIGGINHSADEETLNTEIEPNKESVISEEYENINSTPQPEKAPVLFHADNTKEKKKKSGLWYLLILIPIIVAAIFIFNDQNNAKGPNSNPVKETSVPEQKTPEIQKEPALIDSTQNEISEEQVTDLVKTSQPVDSDSVMINSEAPKFYLVGGGFKEEENAETYLNELKEKGLNPFSMGKKGNFYMVGIGVYKTEGDAVRARREYTENNPGSSAWILEEK